MLVPAKILCFFSAVAELYNVKKLIILCVSVVVMINYTPLLILIRFAVRKKPIKKTANIIATILDIKSFDN